MIFEREGEEKHIELCARCLFTLWDMVQRGQLRVLNRRTEQGEILSFQECVTLILKGDEPVDFKTGMPLMNRTVTTVRGTRMCAEHGALEMAPSFYGKSR